MPLQLSWQSTTLLMLGSRVRAPEGVQSKRPIINDYRSFALHDYTLSQYLWIKQERQSAKIAFSASGEVRSPRGPVSHATEMTSGQVSISAVPSTSPKLSTSGEATVIISIPDTNTCSPSGTAVIGRKQIARRQMLGPISILTECPTMRYCCSNAQPPERRADPSPIATERSNGIRPKTKSGLRVTTGCKLLILKKINNTILQKAVAFFEKST